MSETWPRFRCERFDGESEAHYRQRARELGTIVRAFRTGIIDAVLADELEERMLELQDPRFEFAPDHRAAA